MWRCKQAERGLMLVLQQTIVMYVSMELIQVIFFT